MSFKREAAGSECEMKAIILNWAAAETEERALLESITDIEIEITALTAEMRSEGPCKGGPSAA
ncbi:unnamed protein product [marine sediment metagenome]|uniref:Uncharacterized protein n=1 Tax=marine sediment metagenome TaxID=412755 RepID=X1IVM9_9ZZZZ